MSRSLDHLVVAVRDLDAAGTFYGRLGFQVGARNQHPWGTHNRIVQFPGAFLELITVAAPQDIPEHGPNSFSFGAFVRDYLARREGLAMLVLTSRDAVADAARFEAEGVGSFAPFRFERTARSPEGEARQVAFSLAFARDEAAPNAGFFVCQQHFPENFWNESFQRHPNGALALAGAALAAPDPDRHRAFLEAFTGVPADASAAPNLTFALERGRLDVLGLEEAAVHDGSVEVDPTGAAFVGFTVQVADIAAQAQNLDAAGVPYVRIGTRLIVPASVAHGVAIGFE